MTKGKKTMQTISQSLAQNSTQVSTEVSNSDQDKSIYTLENLIQTLEEAANYLTRQ
ncbi:MAG: hypothetical protein RLZZ507_1221 [Cyanobacteriota bacterium]|jgi:hypothetical protein